jgi:hypothetical protein
MARSRVTFWIVASMLILPPVQLAAQSPDQEALAASAIRAVHAQLVQAAGKLDASALYAHVLDTPTPPIVEDGRVALTRADALANTTAGFQALASVTYRYTRDHITVLSPTAALWVAEGSAVAVLGWARDRCALRGTRSGPCCATVSGASCTHTARRPISGSHGAAGLAPRCRGAGLAPIITRPVR